MTAPGSLDSDMEVEMFLYLTRTSTSWVVLGMYMESGALYFGKTSSKCCFKHQEHVD